MLTTLRIAFALAIAISAVGVIHDAFSTLLRGLSL